MGLLYGPSRKQSQELNQRTGPTIVRQEKRLSRVTSSTTTVDANLIVVPAGYKITLLLVSYYFKRAASSMIYDLKVDGTSWFVSYAEAATLSTNTFTFKYEDGPTAYSTLAVDFTNAPDVHQISILYVQEPAGEGFYA